MATGTGGWGHTIPEPGSRERWVMMPNSAPPIFRLSLPPPVNLIYIIPHRLVQRLTSSVTLDPVKSQSMLSTDPHTTQSPPAFSLAPAAQLQAQGLSQRAASLPYGSALPPLHPIWRASI